MRYFILDDDHIPVAIQDPLEWAVMYEHAGSHVVADTQIGAIRITTLFTGIDARLFSDHLPPQVFATYTRSPGVRQPAPAVYDSWDAALLGHGGVVRGHGPEPGWRASGVAIAFWGPSAPFLDPAR